MPDSISAPLKEKYTREEILLINHLLHEVWATKFKNTLNYREEDKNGDELFIDNVKSLRRELIERYEAYAKTPFTDYEDYPRALRDSILAVLSRLDNNSKYKKLPLPELKIVEAISKYYYDYEPGVKEKRSLVCWNRFKKEFTDKVLNSVKEEEKVEIVYIDSLGDNELYAETAKIEEAEGETKSLRFLSVDLADLKSVNSWLIALLSLLVAFGFILTKNLDVLSDNIFLKLDPETDYSQKTIAADRLSIMSLIQMLLIISLLVGYYSENMGGKRYVDSLDGKGIVRASLLQFQSGWVAIWISLTFLYLWFAYKWRVEFEILNGSVNSGKSISENTFLQYTKFQYVTWLFADFFNLISSVLYFYLYYILDSESVATVNKPYRNLQFRKRMNVIIAMTGAIFVLVCVDRTIKLYYGKTWLIWGSDLFVLIYSLLSVVSMSMFIGRLNSHFFKTDRKLIPLFYVYSASQAGYLILGEENAITQFFIIITVILLKVSLFFEINQLMKNGNFRKYFSRMLIQLYSVKHT